MDLSFFVTNMITMIGLAVGIDYALFIVERYREERRRGAEKLDAIEIAGATASKAVLFSGMTVVLALLGMFLIPTVDLPQPRSRRRPGRHRRRRATLTLVPALLGLLGDRIDWPRRRKYDAAAVAAQQRYDQRDDPRRILGPDHPRRDGPSGRQRGPRGGLLIALAIPYFSLHTGFAGGGIVAARATSRTAYEFSPRDFAVGRLAPVEIVLDGDHAPIVETGYRPSQHVACRHPELVPHQSAAMECRRRPALWSPIN